MSLTRRALLLGLAALPCADSSAKKRKKKKKLQSHKAHHLLATLAARQMHSYRDDAVPIPALVARYHAGEVLHASCGTVSRVAVALLAEVGIRARLVGAVTRQDYNGLDDGHIMVEVWAEKRWRLYDLDNNRQAIGKKGAPLGIAAQMGASPRRWKVIADDPLYAPSFVSPFPPGYPLPPDPAWDDRIFGVPWIDAGGDRFVFHDEGERGRMEALGYHYVEADEWRALAQGR